jgi:hypothetical protein
LARWRLKAKEKDSILISAKEKFGRIRYQVSYASAANNGYINDWLIKKPYLFDAFFVSE